MNRVWKRFLSKLIEPVGFGLYGYATFIIADYMYEQYGREGFIAVASVMFFIPFIAVMLRLMWLRAKSEVERENREMMRQIKGE